jgi:hypothetical protein
MILAATSSNFFSSNGNVSSMNPQTGDRATSDIAAGARVSGHSKIAWKQWRVGEGASVLACG